MQELLSVQAALQSLIAKEAQLLRLEVERAASDVLETTSVELLALKKNQEEVADSLLHVATLSHLKEIRRDMSILNAIIADLATQSSLDTLQVAITDLAAVQTTFAPTFLVEKVRDDLNRSLAVIATLAPSDRVLALEARVDAFLPRLAELVGREKFQVS